MHLTITSPLCINRNILECKALYAVMLFLAKSVLIETYWNVKKSSFLIKSKPSLSINRNILECKGI